MFKIYYPSDALFNLFKCAFFAKVRNIALSTGGVNVNITGFVDKNSEGNFFNRNQASFGLVIAGQTTWLNDPVDLLLKFANIAYSKQKG